MYDILFEMQMSLSDRFQSMTPLTLRREKAREVFLLISRFNRYSEKQKRQQGKPRIIRRPAGDNWF